MKWWNFERSILGCLSTLSIIVFSNSHDEFGKKSDFLVKQKHSCPKSVSLEKHTLQLKSKNAMLGILKKDRNILQKKLHVSTENAMMLVRV